jgi:N utilization substance protein B
MNRRTAREKAVQSLFQIDVGKTDPAESIANVLEENEQPDPFLAELVKGAVGHAGEIDPLIEKQLKHWSMERISKVDRAILRIAVYELEFTEDIPRNVTLNEAVELAKRFGGEESRRFVNGVLSSIAKERGKQ